MANIENLKARARTIQVEVEEGMNSASRVGGLLYDMVNAIDEALTDETPEVDEKTPVVVTPFTTEADGDPLAAISVDNQEPVVIYGVKSSSVPKEVGTPLKEPLKSINSIDSTPLELNSLITYTSSGWRYKTAAEIYNIGKTESGDKKGTEVSISDTLNAGTPIAKIKLDDTTVVLRVPEAEPTNPTTPTPGIDEDAIMELIDGLRKDLGNMHDWSQEQINDMIEEILSGYGFVDGHEDWHWDDEVGAYLQKVGVLNADGSKAWSYLEQKYDEITAAVSALGGDIDGTMTALQSKITQAVDDKIASLHLTTALAWLDENGNQLEWLLSGFRSETTQYESFSEMLSSALTQAKNEATAGVKTEVNTQLASAKAELGSQVDEKLSGFVSKTDLDSTIATMFADDGEAQAIIAAAVEDGISKIQIKADQIDIDGLIDRLDVGTLVSQYISDGTDSIETTYLINRLTENAARTVTVIWDVDSSITRRVTLSTGTSMKYAGERTLVANGGSYNYNYQGAEYYLNSPMSYTFLNSVKVTMGGRDITGTSLSTSSSWDGTEDLKTKIYIESVTDDVVITFTDPTLIRQKTYNYPEMAVGTTVNSSEMNLESSYGGSSVIWTFTSSNPSVITCSGDTMTAAGTGKANVTFTPNNPNLDAFTQEILVLPAGSSYHTRVTPLYSKIIVGNTGAVHSDTSSYQEGNYVDCSYSWSVPSEYSDYITVNSGGIVTGKKKGFAEVVETWTYPQGSISFRLPVLITAAAFDEASTKTVQVDIMGNTTMSYQTIVVAEDGSTSVRTKSEWKGYSKTRPICVVLGDGSDTNITRGSIKSSTSGMFESGSVKVSTYNDVAYLEFVVSKYTDAINYYKGLGRAVTPKDKYQNGAVRTGTIVFAAQDGSEITISVIQNSDYGFTSELTSKTKRAISPATLVPAYMFNYIVWHGTEELQYSDYSPGAIRMPSNNKWYCEADALTGNVPVTGMPDATMGTKEAGVTYNYRIQSYAFNLY